MAQCRCHIPRQYVWKAIWVFIHHFPISGNISRYRELKFPISGNNFPTTGIQISDIGKYGIIFWYREFNFPISGNNSWYREMNLIFRYLEMISWDQEMITRYPEINRITGTGKWFPDIGKSGSGVELAHLAFATDDDEVATVVPPRLQSFRPKAIRPNVVHTLFPLMSP